MSLPVINAPTYELAVPSTKEKITYRPFLVKEEKILLLAMEDGNEKTISLALKQIIENCTDGKVDVEKLALFDLEFIFLRIRAKSVGENVKVNLLCEDDGETYVPVEIPLEEIKVTHTKGHKKTVKLTKEITVTMRYPQLEMMAMQAQGDTPDVEKVFDILGECIDNITEGETIHERIDFNDEELKTFLESLNTKQFESIQNFFETMPKLQHIVEVENPKTKVMNTITLEGMQSFFA
tara:strand:- start:211 stop:921 length:711 start_codon:yes stop_codon:yes gene_type:complete